MLLLFLSSFVAHVRNGRCFSVIYCGKTDTMICLQITSALYLLVGPKHLNTVLTAHSETSSRLRENTDGVRIYIYIYIYTYIYIQTQATLHWWYGFMVWDLNRWFFQRVNKSFPTKWGRHPLTSKPSNRPTKPNHQLEGSCLYIYIYIHPPTNSHGMKPDVRGSLEKDNGPPGPP